LKNENPENYQKLFNGLLSKPAQKKDVFIELIKHLKHTTLEPTHTKVSKATNYSSTLQALKANKAIQLELHQVIKPLYDKIEVLPSSGGIDKFCSNLLILAEKHKIESIIPYINELHLANENFNIELSNNLIKIFKSVYE